MIFQQLEYFIAIADCHSINKAAEYFFISQQALRASLNSLEAKLGFRLFDRSSKGMCLTAAGQAVYQDVKQILALSDTWQRFAELEKELTGSVRIAASTIICRSLLTDVISQCHKEYPKLELIAYEEREDALLKLVSKRMIGILGSAPAPVIKNKLRPFISERPLDMETYAKDEFRVFLNAAHPLASQESLCLDDLSQLSLAIYPNEEDNFYYNQIYSYFSATPFYHIEVQENIFQMISGNVNVASVFPHLSEVNNPYVSSGSICSRHVRDFPMLGITCVIFPSHMTPTEQAVMKILRAHINRVANQLHLEAPEPGDWCDEIVT